MNKNDNARHGTFFMLSIKAFLSPTNLVASGPFKTSLALARSSINDDKQRANTASP